MPIQCTILGFVMFVFLTGCSGRDSAKKDLLTTSPWKYEKAGFADNDGSFDALDPRIAG